MEPTAETATDRAAHIVNVYAFEASLRTDQWLRLRDAIAAAITAAEARAEARGREAGLREAASLVCLRCARGDGLYLVDGLYAHGNVYGICDAGLIHSARAARTGEGEADSADSGGNG